MSASLLKPHRRYVYVRAGDGEGGFTKTLTYYGVLYGSLETFSNEPVMVVNRKSEIVPEDIIGVLEDCEEAQYEVKSVVTMGMANHKRVMLSRRDRPIRPQ